MRSLELTIDKDFLKAFTEVPSIGTACAPAIRLLQERFGNDYTATYVPDGVCLFQRRGAGPGALKAVFVAHADEIGGCVYGLDTSAQHIEAIDASSTDVFASRCWGNRPQIFADAELQAFDYLSKDGTNTFPIKGYVSSSNGEERLIVAAASSRILPYRTAFTFRTETTFSGDTVSGKALDPRVTAFAVCEAVRRLDTPEVGAMIVMAEECAMDVARKGVHFLQQNAPRLELIVNADVPWIENIGEGRLDLPAIRIFEGRNFIDPSFGIRTAETLMNKGVKLHLSAARSGSQTLLFTPLAPTLSVALPSDGIHEPKYHMSLTGTERCIELLVAIGEMSD